MDVSADEAACALTECWEHLLRVSEGWTRRAPGALAGISLVPVPTLNCILVEDTGASPAAIGTLLDAVLASGMPHALEVRPGCAQAIADLAAARGMVRDHVIPMMVLEPSEALIVAGDAADAHDPRTASARGRCSRDGRGRGFRSAAGAVRPADDTGVAGPPRCPQLPRRGGGRGGRDRYGRWAWGVRRRLQHRHAPRAPRRGYGAAVTAHVVRDGFARGARWAWLQATTAGYPVYERLGFRTLESWDCWIAEV